MYRSRNIFKSAGFRTLMSNVYVQLKKTHDEYFTGDFLKVNKSIL